MDTSTVMSLLEQLDDEIDDLEEAFSPLLAAPLLESASKLPLLDKAKLYVLVTYAIESMLFSYLRLNGVKARGHPVFTELTRVKQYFEKIKVAETPDARRENLTLDKGAAARFTKAGLSGNEKYDLERAEQQAKLRAKAHIKFDALSEKTKQDEVTKKQDEVTKKRKFEDEDSKSSDSGSHSISSAETPEESSAPTKKRKKQKPDRYRPENESLPTSGVSSASEKSRKREKSSDLNPEPESSTDNTGDSSIPVKQKEKRTPDNFTSENEQILTTSGVSSPSEKSGRKKKKNKRGPKTRKMRKYPE